MLEIISRPELIKISTHLNNVREITIKKDNPASFNGITRLSDVFSELPQNLIQKNEIRIGATILEEL